MIEARAGNVRRGAWVDGSAGPADWLSLAATPTFAIMALLTTSLGGPMGRLCASGPLAGLSGMTLMYVLMSVFHSPPWLRLLPRILKPREASHLRAHTRGSTDER